jgi:hypothetical protein
MKKVRLNKHDVVLYDSIDELPIVRFHKYNHLVLVDAGIGSDLADFDNHLERVARYIRNKDMDNAAKEMENLRQNIYMVISEQSINHLSFACLVKEIDGQPCEDLSQDGLQKVVGLLSGEKKETLDEVIRSAKKKIDSELQLYFPSLFDDTTTKEYYDLLKRQMLNTLKMIYEGEDEERKAEDEKLQDKLVLFSKPKTYTGSNGVEVKHDKDFESMCLMISKETSTDAKAMTTLAFYNAYEYIKEKARKTQNKAR